MDSRFDPRLPPELIAAAREFDAWSQARLLIEQTESTPTGPLYHYTREVALKNILANERLWCFSHLHQKDPREFAFSLDVARRVIREVGKSEDGVTRHFCACLEDLLETNDLADVFEFYVFSLSRHRDHERQWREYGDAGCGFAIGFSPTLFQPTQTELNEQANENIHMGRVIYGEGPTIDRHRLVIERAAEITSRFAWANQSLVRQINPSIYLVTMAREVLASQLIWNCLTSKESKFADEHEIRCIIMNIRKNFDAHRQSHKDRLYVEIPMPLKVPGHIVEILVGPLAPTGAEGMVAEFLKAQGYSDMIPIIRSAVAL